MMTVAIGVISIIFQPSVLKPYRSRLANLLETAININFLFLLLINATSFFHDDFFTFSSLTESSSSSECACNPELFKKVHGLQLYACACGCLHYKYSSSIFKVHVCNVSYLMRRVVQAKQQRRRLQVLAGNRLASGSMKQFYTDKTGMGLSFQLTK